MIIEPPNHMKATLSLPAGEMTRTSKPNKERLLLISVPVYRTRLNLMDHLIRMKHSCIHHTSNVDGFAGAFHVFTSNVDAHFYDMFEACEIHDCHGNIELWQCSNRDCESGIWRAPIEHHFAVDTYTMLAPQKKTASSDSNTLKDEYDNSNIARLGHTTGSGQRLGALHFMPPAKDQKGWYQEDEDNYPKCGHCMSRARPSIFCFGDFGWKYDKSQSIRWDLWREVVVDLSLNVCVVEVGCGQNVQACRVTSEKMVEDVIEKGGNAKLVRINPDYPSSSDPSVEKYSIPIMSKGLRAIQRIDEIYFEKYSCSQQGR